ncbi:MAG: Holliday junction resolvase RuvX [Acidimicrobiia bacterium]|nr:Holliday junction resolvase RuvX [Acidimicrobiia bacterium]
MGVDYGTRRVGVALSDPLHITARGHSVLDAAAVDVVAAIAEIAREREVERVVVGLPVSLSGYEGPSAEAARDLAGRIAAATGLPVELSDERFTTRTAESSLIEANVRRRRRRQLIDQVAAAVMLQHYLDRT